MGTGIKKLSVLLWKDLALIWRAPGLVLSIFFFAIMMLLSFQFAFDQLPRENYALFSGVLWTLYLFSSLILFVRGASLEQEGSGKSVVRALFLSPVSPGLLFASKWLTNAFSFLFVQLWGGVFFLLFLNPPLANWQALLMVSFLGGLGFTTIGTLFAMLAVQTKTRELTMAVLYFPFMSPLLLAVTKMTTELFTNSSPFSAWSSPWFKLLCGFDVIFLLLAYLFFGLLYGGEAT